jgi:hypothetical protein
MLNAGMYVAELQEIFHIRGDIMRRLGSVTTIMIFICVNMIFYIQDLSAQEVSALGEMRSYGDVFIRSSVGEWVPAPATYPILPNTAIATKKGNASLNYKDGSRVNLSEATMAVVDGTKASYTVHLEKGALAVNSSPKASMTVTHGSTDILINADPDSSHRGSGNQPQRFLGTIHSTDNGMELKSISGSSAVKVSAADTKVISSGQGIFVGPDNLYKTYTSSQKHVKSKKCSKKKHHKKNASPYCFDHERDEEYCWD